MVRTTTNSNNGSLSLYDSFTQQFQLLSKTQKKSPLQYHGQQFVTRPSTSPSPRASSSFMTCLLLLAGSDLSIFGDCKHTFYTCQCFHNDDLNKPTLVSTGAFSFWDITYSKPKHRGSFTAPDLHGLALDNIHPTHR
jgi:hypothetical protein